VAKKLVRGDYKSGRVKDPTAKISSNHEKTVKKYVKEYMDKAVKKKEEREKQKVAHGGGSKDDSPGTPLGEPKDGDVEWTNNDIMDASPVDSAPDHKRKRGEELGLDSPKRTRTASEDVHSAPPPPPPPPASTEVEDFTPMDDAFPLSFPEATEGEILKGKAAMQLDGYGSPMQLATPPTNGSGSRPVNGDRHP
jgi:histone-lysine N-methyltransferase SETD2